MASTEEQKEAERAQRELVSYAKGITIDLYALLDLPSPFSSISPDARYAAPSDADLNKAWRKAALKNHPDKNRGDEKAAADRLDEARRAWEVLKDPEARAVYEGRRRAEVERRQRELALQGRRRDLAEALRKGEEAASSPAGLNGGVGEGRPGATARQDDNEAKARRFGEEARRRVAEFQEAAKRKREQDRRSARDEAGLETKESQAAKDKQDETQVPEIDRTVKVRWPRGSAVGDAITADSLQTMFSRFGNVESAIMLKDKKIRPSTASPAAGVSPVTPFEKKAKKQVMASAVVVFKSIVAAHAAVSDAMTVASKASSDTLKQNEEAWSVLDSVSWAAGQAPNLGFESDSRASSRPTSSAGVVPQGESDPFVDTAPIPAAASTFTPLPPFPGLSTDTTRGSKATPPQTSFTPSGKGPSFSFRKQQPNLVASPAPSNYEVTMMRLKEAERRRLAEQIREDEARTA